jgi:hypothetical protein
MVFAKKPHHTQTTASQRKHRKSGAEITVSGIHIYLYPSLNDEIAGGFVTGITYRMYRINITYIANI